VPPGRRASGTGWSALGVFLACLGIYHANGRPQPEVDCVVAPYTAWSLVRHGSVDLRPYPELRPYHGTEVLRLPDGRRVSSRPPGSALAAVPFVAPLALTRDRPPGTTAMAHLGKLTASSSVAGAAALLFLLCRRVAPAGAWPAAILFALGTSLWSVASQALWMHGPATFWLCLALNLLLPPAGEPSARRTAGAGLALGLAVLTRPTVAFFPLASGLELLLRRRWRAAAALALGGAFPVGLLCLVNFRFFGHALTGGYGTGGWDAPVWLSVAGLLLAPSRGVLVYSPALLLVPLGARAALARRGHPPAGLRPLVLAWLAATALTVALYARWGCWWAGWSYGPRFFCETMPLCCLLFALGYAALRAPRHRRLAGLLVLLSVGLHALGVFGHSAHVPWHGRHDRADQGRCLFELSDTEIEAHARAVAHRVLGVLRPF
jgi:hypothetical protein